MTIDEFETFLKNDNSVNFAELREAFDLFDVNGNGYITKDELVKAMKNVGENLSDGEINSMIRNADLNSDGQVSFEGEEYDLLVNLVERSPLDHPIQMYHPARQLRL